MNPAARRLGAFLRGNLFSLFSMAVRVAGVAASFVVTLVIARWFGPSANGEYALYTQTALFLSVVAVGGLDNAAMREFSRTQVDKLKLGLPTLLRALGQAMAVAAVLCGGLLLAGRPLLELLKLESASQGGLVILCVMILARTAIRLLSAVVRSQGEYSASQGIEMVLLPLATLLLLALAMAAGMPLAIFELLWIVALAGVLTGFVGLIATLRHCGIGPRTLDVPSRTMLATAIPLWGASIAMTMADWYGLAVLGATRDMHETGIYRVAFQFAAMFQIVAFGLFSAYSPKLSAAFHAAQRLQAARLMRSATIMATMLMAPLGAIALVMAEELLGFVGEEFVAGANTLRLLMVGQMFYVITGIAGQALAMAGHPRINFQINLVTLGLILVATPFLADRFGGLGMAMMICGTLAFKNLASMFQLYRLEGINAVTGSIRPD